jgi:hypothetical protein
MEGLDVGDAVGSEVVGKWVGDQVGDILDGVIVGDRVKKGAGKRLG